MTAQKTGAMPLREHAASAPLQTKLPASTVLFYEIVLGVGAVNCRAKPQMSKAKVAPIGLARGIGVTEVSKDDNGVVGVHQMLKFCSGDLLRADGTTHVILAWGEGSNWFFFTSENTGLFEGVIPKQQLLIHYGIVGWGLPVVLIVPWPPSDVIAGIFAIMKQNWTAEVAAKPDIWPLVQSELFTCQSVGFSHLVELANIYPRNDHRRHEDKKGHYRLENASISFITKGFPEFHYRLQWSWFSVGTKSAAVPLCEVVPETYGVDRPLFPASAIIGIRWIGTLFAFALCIQLIPSSWQVSVISCHEATPAHRMAGSPR